MLRREGSEMAANVSQTLCNIDSDVFGETKDGKTVKRYTLRNSTRGLEVRIIEYGGIITEVKVPDRNGKIEDVELGFDDMEGYESSRPYIGALMGRVAGRIAGGQFTLDGETYNLSLNDGPSSLHGGKEGFDQKLWDSRVEGDKLIMHRVSCHGEENYPGNLSVTVTFQVTEENELKIDFVATTDRATPVNLTSHPSINLAGHNAGTLDDHEVTIHSDSFTVLNNNSVPTGEIHSVADKDAEGMDLRKPKKMKDVLNKVSGGRGFDHNYCLTPNKDGQPKLAARVDHPLSGRYMECYTTEPGMQFYTSFYVDVAKAKGDARYKPFGAVCLEAQHYPNSPNIPSFPNVILRPNETYRQTTIYKFGIA